MNLFFINDTFHMYENVSTETCPNIFPQLDKYMKSQKLLHVIHKSRDDSIDLNQLLYKSIIIYFLNILNSKLTYLEAQILINKMILEHKLNNVAKDHLLSL